MADEICKKRIVQKFICHERKIEKVNVDEDHLHMQIEIALNIAVSEVVKRLKRYSGIGLSLSERYVWREIFGA